MITVIAIIIATILIILDELKGLILFSLFCLITYIIIKEIKNRKYSRNPFKKIEETTIVDYIIMMINESKQYKKHIINNDNIILITETNIYFMKILELKNKITGKMKDNYLVEEIGSKKYKIKNVIKNYNEEYYNYQNKIKENIKKYVIIRNDCNMSIDDKDIKIIHNKNLLFEIDKGIKKYSRNDIDNIYNKLL